MRVFGLNDGRYIAASASVWGLYDSVGKLVKEITKTEAHALLLNHGWKIIYHS